ncbi:MAG: S46 family peptidase [Bacteroidales bacterium]|nr:S46 family peptidase [Bacteroidales bacterium]
MRRYFLTVIMLAAGLTAAADEGMWMIQAIDSALEKKMQERGLELSAGEIYDADAPGATIADAIVSLEFGCTGSIISDQGLMITNHHCAYGDVHKLSTPEHNYLDEGFWAMHSDEEVNINGKSVLFLKKVIDVTDEVNARKTEAEADKRPMGMRKLSYLIETEYKNKTGLEAYLSSMWDGSKYYIALYEVYKDVRLVAAPPVSAAAFGGDIDNWEWPQHKCDFAMYRIYTAPDGSPAEYSEENVPLKPKAKLKISLDGYKAGDYTMILGYPGSTNRYSNSYEVRFNQTVKQPICNSLRGGQMEIIKKWMDADPEIRLKYSDYFFTLSNIQELFSGEVECIDRFDVISRKEAMEKELQEWIEASPERMERWGNLLNDLKTKYLAVETPERNINYFRETVIRGTRISRACSKLNAFRTAVMTSQGITPKKPFELKGVPDPVETEFCCTYKFCGKRFEKNISAILKEYKGLDLRVEKDLFRFAVEQFYRNVDHAFIGDFQKKLYHENSVYLTGIHGGMRTDYDKITDYIWNNSFFTDKERLDKFLSEEHTLDEYLGDPLFRFLQEVKITVFNDATSAAEGEISRSALNKEFTHALYQMRLDKGIVQYPDANSTMRITYGTVGGYEPRDGIVCDWKTTPEGILEKYDPADYDFTLNDRQYLLYRQGDWGKWGFGAEGSNMYVNFLTDNDITGGNSGSPVLNSRGELIGLAFDGNKESLASDVWCTPGYNKCVCVDIRFVLWTLDRYAGMTRIIEELGL